MSDHEQTKRPPPTPEDEADIDMLAFMAMREIHKRGGTPIPTDSHLAHRGQMVERTPGEQVEHEHNIRRDARLLSRAVAGLKFNRGRKTGATSPIRKAIARELKKSPGMKNPELWDAIAAKPPKGWEFCDNSLGRYAEASGGKNMGYKRFCNVCGEERGKLKG